MSGRHNHSSITPHRFVFWGTFDTGKPRVRMLLKAARQIDPGLPICHKSPWTGIEDKSQVKGIASRLSILIDWITCYPRLIFGYLRLPPHEIVVVPYLGNFDVMVLWPLARLRGAKICWDMFISLYDTVVRDRKLVSESSIAARLLYALEWLSTRASDLILLDTNEHARYVSELYRVPESKAQSVWVGVESDIFRRAKAKPDNSCIRVLFYGQFIPLHGLTTLIHAIDLVLKDKSAPYMQFTLVGKGQEEGKIDKIIKDLSIINIERVEWVEYEELPAIIASSDICLGIFSEGGKAARVIPNKIFQILAVGRPLVTRDSPAIREILKAGPAVRLIPPDDPRELARALIELARDLLNPETSAGIYQSASTQMPVVDADIIRDQLHAATESLL